MTSQTEIFSTSNLAKGTIFPVFVCGGGEGEGMQTWSEERLQHIFDIGTNQVYLLTFSKVG